MNPDRISVSLPESDELDKDTLEEHVEKGEWSSLSELVREAIRGEIEPDDEER